MAKHNGIRKTSLQKLAGCVRDWSGGTGGVDRLGLFAIHAFNPEGKWDWYEIGGRWDGFLPGNAMGAQTLLKSKNLAKLLPHDFLTPDGEWHEVETFVRAGWLGGHFERTNEKKWLSEFQEALRTYAKYSVVCVDRHC